MVDENKNTVDASQVKPNITIEFGEPNMDRILLNRIEDIERRLYELEVKWKSKMQFKIG